MDKALKWSRHIIKFCFLQLAKQTQSYNRLKGCQGWGDITVVLALPPLPLPHLATHPHAQNRSI